MKCVRKRAYVFIIVAIILLSGALWTCQRNANMNEEEGDFILSDSDREMLLTLFSMTPSSRHDESDFYYPPVIQSLMMWQREGISSWLVDGNGEPIIGDPFPVGLQEEFEWAKRWKGTTDENRNLYEHMNLLLYGNFTIVGIEEMGGAGPQLVNEGAVELTVYEFVKALDSIDMIPGISIEQEWNAHLWRLLREEE